jgi:hypothetical protein
MERKCCLCDCAITGCFGYVLAGDWIEHISGRRRDVRELCGKDVLRLDLISERSGRGISEITKQYIC